MMILVERLASEKKINDARIARLIKRDADAAAKLVQEVNAVAAGDTAEEPETEENVSDAVAEDKPQE